MTAPTTTRRTATAATSARRAADRTAGQAERDLRLVRLLAVGLAPKTAARRLGCSDRTVRRRLGWLCAATGTRNATHLVAWAAANGLVTVATEKLTGPQLAARADLLLAAGLADRWGVAS